MPKFLLYIFHRQA